MIIVAAISFIYMAGWLLLVKPIIAIYAGIMQSLGFEYIIIQLIKIFVFFPVVGFVAFFWAVTGLVLFRKLI